MIEITAEIRAQIDKAAEKTVPAEDEYINPSDGLLYCKRCGTPRQVVVPHPFGQGYLVHRCVCTCRREAIEWNAAEEERMQRAQRIRRRKSQGLQDRYLYDYTFANDTSHDSAQLGQARAYVENWSRAFHDNVGLLLFGDVGTGKSFAAGCIANALLERDVPRGQNGIYRQSGCLRSPDS